jgi:hypothetical protein
MRVFPGRVRPVVVAAEKLSQAISQVYAHHEGSPQQVVGDISTVRPPIRQISSAWIGSTVGFYQRARGLFRASSSRTFCVV